MQHLEAVLGHDSFGVAAQGSDLMHVAEPVCTAAYSGYIDIIKPLGAKRMPMSAARRCLTLKAMVRTASAMLFIRMRSLGSGVASTRNSDRLSPICACRAALSAFRSRQHYTAAYLHSIAPTLALVITALRRDAARRPRAGFALNALTPAKQLWPSAEDTTLTLLGAEGLTNACMEPMAQ